MRSRAIVVHPGEGHPGPATPGMERRTLHEAPGTWAGCVRTDAGVSSGWHHHGGNDSYIYVLKGMLTIEFGPGGQESIAPHTGDVNFNPAPRVHPATTGSERQAEAFVVRVGEGPQLVNLEGPEPG